jgi:hypothetical protein
MSEPVVTFTTGALNAIKACSQVVCEEIHFILGGVKNILRRVCFEVQIARQKSLDAQYPVQQEARFKLD